MRPAILTSSSTTRMRTDPNVLGEDERYMKETGRIPPAGTGSPRWPSGERPRPEGDEDVCFVGDQASDPLGQLGRRLLAAPRAEHDVLDITDEVEGFVGQGCADARLAPQPERTHGPVVTGELLQQALGKGAGLLPLAEAQGGVDHGRQIGQISTIRVLRPPGHLLLLAGSREDAVRPVNPR